jgi:hypothetical protein
VLIAGVGDQATALVLVFSLVLMVLLGILLFFIAGVLLATRLELVRHGAHSRPVRQAGKRATPRCYSP